MALQIERSRSIRRTKHLLPPFPQNESDSPLRRDGADDGPLVLELVQHRLQHLALGVRLRAAVLESAPQPHRRVVHWVLRRQFVLEVLQR